jgi:hypothetical protein
VPKRSASLSSPRFSGDPDHHDSIPSYAACHHRPFGDAIRQPRLACADGAAGCGTSERRSRSRRQTEGAAEGSTTRCRPRQTGASSGRSAAAASRASASSCRGTTSATPACAAAPGCRTTAAAKTPGSPACCSTSAAAGTSCCRATSAAPADPATAAGSAESAGHTAGRRAGAPAEGRADPCAAATRWRPAAGITAAYRCAADSNCADRTTACWHQATHPGDANSAACSSAADPNRAAGTARWRQAARPCDTYSSTRRSAADPDHTAGSTAPGTYRTTSG